MLSNNLSLKKLLIIVTGVLLFTVVSGVSVFNYFTFESLNYNESIKFRKQQGQSTSIQMDNYISSIEYKLGMIASAIEYNDEQIINESVVVDLLYKLNSSASGVATYIVFEDGSSLEHNGKKYTDVNTNNGWYTNPKRERKFVITDPKFDEIVKKVVSSFSIPLVKNGRFIGVIGVDITSDTWQKLVSENVADGQVFLTDRHDKVLYAPYPEFLGKSLFDLRPMYRNFTNDFMQYQIDSGQSFLATKFNHSRYGVSVYTYENMDVILAPSKDMLTTSFVIAVLSIALSLGVIYLIIVRFIYLPIGGEPREIQTILEHISEGDLTVDVSNQGNATGVYAATVKMVENLKKVVGGINTQSHQVEQTSGQLTSLVEETKQSSDSQITQMEMTATAMNEMVSTVEEISRNAQQASSSATDAFSQAQNGADVTRKTAQVIESLGADINAVSQTIDQLRVQTVNVGDVLGVIRGIAEQTNLLALNAAIEAARAGEQGRGFAVVADEVRSLASRTQDSIQEINGTIEELQKVAHAAVDSMEQSQSNTQGAIDMATEARESLSAILQSVDQIQDMNSQIATAAEEQNAVAQEINQSVIEVNGLAKSTNENAESTNLSTQQLSQVVEGLSAITSRFTLR